MKTIALLLLTALSLHAQETKKDAAPAADAAKPAAVTPEMEAKFKTTLTNAVMDGRFCMIAGGKLSPDKEEKYTIAGVEKTGDGQWTITAKIEYDAHGNVAKYATHLSRHAAASSAWRRSFDSTAW